MPAAKKPQKKPEARKNYVNQSVEAYIGKLQHYEALSDKEVALFATLLQTVDNDTLRATIGERMDGWERRLGDMERMLESRAALQQTMSGRGGPTHRGPPNLNPLEDNHRR